MGGRPERCDRGLSARSCSNESGPILRATCQEHSLARSVLQARARPQGPALDSTESSSLCPGTSPNLPARCHSSRPADLVQALAEPGCRARQLRIGQADQAGAGLRLASITDRGPGPDGGLGACERTRSGRRPRDAGLRDRARLACHNVRESPAQKPRPSSRNAAAGIRAMHARASMVDQTEPTPLKAGLSVRLRHRPIGSAARTRGGKGSGVPGGTGYSQPNPSRVNPHKPAGPVEPPVGPWTRPGIAVHARIKELVARAGTTGVGENS
jgi:hypothetical protein